MFPDSIIEKILFGLGLLATAAAMATRAHAEVPNWQAVAASSSAHAVHSAAAAVPSPSVTVGRQR